MKTSTKEITDPEILHKQAVFIWLRDLPLADFRAVCAEFEYYFSDWQRTTVVNNSMTWIEWQCQTQHLIARFLNYVPGA